MKKLFLFMATIVAAMFVVDITYAQTMQKTDKARTSAEQEMIELSHKKWQLMAEKNTDELARLFHDEAQFVHMGGYWGKEQELKTISSGGIWYKEAEIHSVEVKFTKNTAIVYSRIHLNAVVGGHEVRNPFIVSEVYVKEKGKWLLSVLAFTKTMGR
ncbi:MAG: nuclear transport factor 2 family protein [Alistipes sp.]|nr:nuclear transport factor 2 family protein [Alistipes sp.]